MKNLSTRLLQFLGVVLVLGTIFSGLTAQAAKPETPEAGGYFFKWLVDADQDMLRKQVMFGDVVTGRMAIQGEPGNIYTFRNYNLDNGTGYENCKVNGNNAPCNSDFYVELDSNGLGEVVFDYRVDKDHLTFVGEVIDINGVIIFQNQAYIHTDTFFWHETPEAGICLAQGESYSAFIELDNGNDLSLYQFDIELQQASLSECRVNGVAYDESLCSQGAIWAQSGSDGIIRIDMVVTSEYFSIDPLALNMMMFRQDPNLGSLFSGHDQLLAYDCTEPEDFHIFLPFISKSEK